MESTAPAGRAEPTTRRLCVVYGNCQAEGLGQVLDSSPAFAAEYRVVAVPAVHMLTSSELREIEQLVAGASLIVAQPVKPGYRGMGLGTDEVTAAAPKECRVIRIPVLYYQGLFPFQAFVHHGGESGRQHVNAPLTGRHHDLRILGCAAQGMEPDAAVDWLRSFAPNEAAVREIADAAATEFRRRERDTDIPVFDRIVSSPASHAGSFFTLNHPSRITLRHVSEAIHEELGLPFEDLGAEEPLDNFKTPLDEPVLKALGLPRNGRTEWVVDGEHVPTETLVDAHLAFYRERPEVVEAALREHVRRLRSLAVLKVRRALSQL